MSRVVLDDHLLRDLLADDPPPPLRRLLARRRPVTTNLYLYRLTRSVLASSGGRLTGSWPPEERRALGARLLDLGPDVDVLPMAPLTVRMAALAGSYRLSTLGAEAMAVAESLDAPLCVWSGDDGPQIRTAARELGVTYRTIDR